MSHQIKLTITQAEQYQAHKIALGLGISVAEVARRGLQKMINAPHVQDQEAILDRSELRGKGGKRIVAALLSEPLSKAIRTIANAEHRSESHVLRELLRFELRRRGLLPNKQWGSQDAIEARAAIDPAPASETALT
jgi:hypothetical protein